MVGNIWEKANEDIPYYMKKICDAYGLRCIKISPLKTAVVGEKYALIIAVDRFDAKVSYLDIDKEKRTLYLCDNYFAEKYDADDRVGLLDGEGADIIVRNNIIVISNGLASKWADVLRGDKRWILNYKKSKWFSIGNLLPAEEKKINTLIFS